MADGTYKLIKENSGGTFDEKSVLAEDGKVLGFDSSLDPQMVTIASSTLSINDQSGTTYTLVLADAGKYIRCENAADVTVTVPKNSSVAFDTGTVITIEQKGAGTVTVAPVDGDVTLNAYDGLSTYGQYAGLQLVKVDTNVWTCIAGVGA